MLKLASSLGLALAVADLKRRIQHWVRSGVYGAVGAVFALIAVTFFLIALHLWLSGLISPIASALIIGGVMLVIALILFFVASRPLDARAPVAAASASPGAEMADALREGAARLSAAAGGQNSPLRSPVFIASAAALAAGILFGRSSKRRRKDEDES